MDNISNVGLSERMFYKLKEITSDYFTQELDCYRFAISLSIYHKLPFKDRVLENRTSKKSKITFIQYID